MIKQAFVLGAGLGTRLRPLTDNLPKPLVPIFQKPLITFAFDHLIDAGIRKFFVNTHRQPELFAQMFGRARPAGAPGRGVKEDIEKLADATGGRALPVYCDIPIEFRSEPLLLETGGGIKNMEDSLGTEPFIVYSGDILTDVDLAPLIDEHFRRQNDVTLGLRKTGLDEGVVLRDSQIVAIRKKDEPRGDYDFAGISIWNASIFPRIPGARKVSFIPILVDWIKHGGRIGGVVLSENKWFNIGTRTDYLEAHRAISAANWKPNYVKTPDWPISIARDAIVSPSAQLSGFYSIGEGCSVGDGAAIEDTIVWPGAQIASRSHLRNCIVRSHRKAQGALHDLDI
jgi:mannose-1-phosphate guanylyltransferase